MKKQLLILSFLLLYFCSYSQENQFYKEQLTRIGIEVGFVRFLSTETRLYNAGELFISYEVFPNFRFGTGIMSTFPRKLYGFSKINSIFSDNGYAFFDGYHFIFFDFGKNNLHYRFSLGGIQRSGVSISSGLKYYFYKKRAFCNFEHRVVAFKHSNFVVGLGFKIK
jgi:hypothetical protein